MWAGLRWPHGPLRKGGGGRKMTSLGELLWCMGMSFSDKSLKPEDSLRKSVSHSVFFKKWRRRKSGKEGGQGEKDGRQKKLVCCMWDIFIHVAKNSCLQEIGSLPRSGGAISYNLKPIRCQNPSSSARGLLGGLASWFPLHILLLVPHFTRDYPGLCTVSSLRITFHKTIKSEYKVKWGDKGTSGF